MGNCSTCGCNDKGEIQTYEVKVDGNRKTQNGAKGSTNSGKSINFSDNVFKDNVHKVVRL
jgi:hypothetical protein